MTCTVHKLLRIRQLLIPSFLGLKHVRLSPDSYRYESTLTLRQPLLKDSGKYTLNAISGSSADQFSFTLKVKGNQKGLNKQRKKPQKLGHL